MVFLKLCLTGFYHLISRKQFWRARMGEFVFLLPLVWYLANPCFGENLIANIRCSLEPLLEPDLYFSWG